MRVSLGTIGVEDDVRKEIRARVGGKGHATRAEVKDYLLELINDHSKVLVAGEAEEAPETESPESPQIQTEWSHPENTVTGTMPEPTAGGTTATSTTAGGGSTPSAEGSTPTTGTGATTGA